MKALNDCACLWEVALHHPGEFKALVERVQGLGVTKLGPLELAPPAPKVEPRKPLTDAEMRERAVAEYMRRMDVLFAATSMRPPVPEPYLNGKSNVAPDEARRGSTGK